MKIDLDFAELHAPLFFGNKSFGTKLYQKQHAGIKLVYDRAEKELIVEWNGVSTIVPVGNVANMVAKPAAAVEAKFPTEVKPAAPMPELARTRTAQVSSPQGHVHAGPGHGQTGQEANKKVVL